jgi:Tol biopolymer transport system component
MKPVIIALFLFITLAPVRAQPLADAVTCPDFIPSRLIHNWYATLRQSAPSNLRAIPSTDGDIIGSIDAGAQFIVLDALVCTQGKAWWRVQYGDLEGWTVEGDNGGYWTEPLPFDAAVQGRLLAQMSTLELPQIETLGLNESAIVYNSDKGIGVVSPSGILSGALGVTDGVLASPHQWSADGQTLAVMRYETRDGYTPSVDTIDLVNVVTGNVERSPRFADLMTYHHVDYSIALSPDGESVLVVVNPFEFVGEVYRLSRLAPRAWLLENVSNSFANDDLPLWSPDGAAFAFASDRDRGSQLRDIFIVASDAAPRNLTAGLATTQHLPLAWSPDGTQIALLATSDSGNELNVVEVTSGELVERITPFRGDAPQVVWTADGIRIAYGIVGSSDTVEQITVREVDSSERIVAEGRGGLLNWSWSPDGRQLVYESPIGIFVVGVDGLNLRQLDSPGSFPLWRP